LPEGKRRALSLRAHGGGGKKGKRKNEVGCGLALLLKRGEKRTPSELGVGRERGEDI